MTSLQKVFFVVIVFTLCLGDVHAHSGPPFPIVTDYTAKGYTVSVWTDPDSTDDKTPAGRFWVTSQPGADRVVVSIKPTDRDGGEQSGRAEAVNGDSQRHFVALLMDHEGRFSVHVSIDGARGHAEVDTYTDATYDLRPRPILMVLFILPFVLVGFVWGKLLIKRRMHAKGAN